MTKEEFQSTQDSFVAQVIKLGCYGFTVYKHHVKLENHELARMYRAMITIPDKNADATPGSEEELEVLTRMAEIMLHIARMEAKVQGVDWDDLIKRILKHSDEIVELTEPPKTGIQ